MNRKHSKVRSSNPRVIQTITATALNLLMLLSPIAALASVPKAEEPVAQKTAEKIPEAQPANGETPEVPQANLLIPEAQQAADAIPAPQKAAYVDAAFYLPSENASYFFQGDHYYRLTALNVDSGYPRKLPGEFKGLPAYFQSGIDAAVVDPFSGHIYFFKGNKYSVFNPATKTVFPGYGEVTMPGGWRGLPAEFTSDLDAAINEDGAVVLIKGNRRAIVKNEAFVRTEDFSATALTGTGLVNAAFKYSNGRNYFFSGDMFSRAIAFVREPRQLNPITPSWVGIKPPSLFSPVDPNATKVTEVDYGSTAAENGLYRQVADRSWEYREGGRPYDKLAAKCDELSRGRDTINLSCANNTYKIEINLVNKNITKIEGGRRTTVGVVRTTDTFKIIPAEDLKDPFRPGDIQKIMAWISKETSNSKIDYCYKNTIGRGVGTPVTTCPAGTEKGPGDQVCYPKCRAGFSGVGPVCWGTCPQGFTDIGAFCQKNSDYQRETFAWQVGYPPLPQPGAFAAMKSKCEAKYGAGNCEIKGSAAYPKCRPGYTQGGAVTICAQSCPAGWADTGTGCTKPTYGRGGGVAMTCAPGLQEQAGLCYQNCSPGYQAVGPICWQQCKGFQGTECGVGCAADANACASATADMVLAPFNLVVGLVSMGVSARVEAAAKAAQEAGEAAAKAAADAAFEAGQGTASATTNGLATLALEKTPKWQKLISDLKNLDALGKAELVTTATGTAFDLSGIGQGLRDEIEHWTDDYEDNFALNTTKGVEAKIRSQFDYNTQRYIKRYYALHHLGAILESDGWRIGKLVMTIGSVATGFIGDPGFLATINAYSQPMCPPPGGTPFPRVVRTDSGVPFSASGTKWDLMAGRLVQVSVGDDGTAWGLDKDNNIYQWTGRLTAITSSDRAKWIGVPGKLKQISVGSIYYVFGVNAAGEVYGRLQGKWNRLPTGAMSQVSVGNDGKLWGLDTAGNIYRWDVPDNNILKGGGGSPTRVPGKLKQISVGNAKHVWGVNASNRVYRWNGTSWTPMPGTLKQVSVGSDGTVWGLSPNNEIFRWTGRNWEKIPGGLNNISVGDSQLVWGVNRNSQIFSRSF